VLVKGRTLRNHQVRFPQDGISARVHVRLPAWSWSSSVQPQSHPSEWMQHGRDAWPSERLPLWHRQTHQPFRAEAVAA
jgi:hypothetical protein